MFIVLAFFVLSTVQDVVASIQVIRKRIKGDLVLVTGKTRREISYTTFQMSLLQIYYKREKNLIKLYFWPH